MGILMRFPTHARASDSAGAGPASANASKVISDRPFSPASRTSAGHLCAGMPRVRQVLTVLGGTSRASETALVPPKASIAEFGVSDITANIVRVMRTCQGFANCEAPEADELASIWAMPGALKLQKRRLKAVRMICFRGTQQGFALKLGLSKGHWADFENGNRPLTLEVARKIKALYNLPIEWLATLHLTYP